MTECAINKAIEVHNMIVTSQRLNLDAIECGQYTLNRKFTLSWSVVNWTVKRLGLNEPLP